jgi:hypothetical protein
MLKPLFQKVPPKVRYILYALYAGGSVVLADLASRGIVSSTELELWSALGAVFGVGAAANVDHTPKDPAA